MQDFVQRLYEQTPRAYWTYTLLIANMLVFAAMVVTGVSFMSPNSNDLLAWGANFSLKTLQGEPWRLLSSAFIHIGIIHLAFNMFCLESPGILLERLIGNTNFLILYLYSAIAGSLASLAWSPNVVSAGASGALFGLYGGLMACYLRAGHSIPLQALTNLKQSATTFVGYNLIYGLFVPGIDMACHVGGLVGGFLAGLVLAHPVDPVAARRRPLLLALLVLVAAATLLPAFVLIERWGTIPDFEAFSRAESKILDRFNDEVQRWQKMEIDDAGMMHVIEEEVIPPWRAEKATLVQAGRVPRSMLPLYRAILDYMERRDEAWGILVQGIRDKDPNFGARYETKQTEIGLAIERIREAAENQ